MSVATKSYVDAMSAGLTLHANQPTIPVIGDAYYDVNNACSLVWDGSAWVVFSSMPAKPIRQIPTQDELEAHPSLKDAWEQYLVIRRLLGI